MVLDLEVLLVDDLVATLLPDFVTRRHDSVLLDIVRLRSRCLQILARSLPAPVRRMPARFLLTVEDGESLPTQLVDNVLTRY